MRKFNPVRFFSSLIVGLTGFILIYFYGNLLLAIGVFLMEFAHNIEWHKERP